MLPNVTFLTLDLYNWMILLGLVFAFVLFRVFCDKNIPVKVFNFSLIAIVVAIVAGFFSATLFQSIYNYVASGVWKWQGMTFLGGLVGGVAFFAILYFAFGAMLFPKKEHLYALPQLLCNGAPCIALAHGFGRIGCLFAGCCYGKISDTIGLQMWVNGVLENRVPTQLFEALFLFVLCGVLSYLLCKKQSPYVPSVYTIGYGVWRFVLEFFRDDPRGSTGTALSPSQLTSIVLLLVGAGYFLLVKFVLCKQIGSNGEQTE